MLSISLPFVEEEKNLYLYVTYFSISTKYVQKHLY